MTKWDFQLFYEEKLWGQELFCKARSRIDLVKVMDMVKFDLISQKKLSSFKIKKKELFIISRI